MGFHVCEYCQKSGEAKPATSSGDVTLSFSNGKQYMVPDMLPHYVSQHGFCPPEQFVSDVLNTEFTGGSRRQTRSVPEQVGYLSGEFVRGPVPEIFLEKLKRVMEIAVGLRPSVITKAEGSDGKVYRGEE